ncbi:MAG: energy transducer TonB [Acidobacteriota bacterium]|jgi:TonB family protein
MTHRSTLVLAILCALAILSAAPGGPLAAEGIETGDLPTHFLLLTGSPEPAAEGTSGVLMVPGTVIPVTAGRPGAESVDALLESGRAATDLTERLRKTMRLTDVQVQYAHSEVLPLDGPVGLPAAVPGSTVYPVVTLLGLTDELATYRVVFRDGREELSDTSVSIPLGRRSVVGALDGPEAPYLFLVVEPPSSRPVTVDPDAGVSPPRRIAGPAPSYPEDARKERIEGTVVIQAVIEKDGRVSHTRVLKSLSPSLDRASREAIGGWTFEPARLDGDPVSVFYTLTINYRLDKEKHQDEGGAGE